ncbi:MAG: hypothetical protein WA906_09595, partial [Pacificimonas sp.]
METTAVLRARAMGGLYLVEADDRATNRIADARAQFARHGFTAFEEIDAPGLTGFHAPPYHGGPDSLYRDGSDLIAVAGTLSYDKKLGKNALAALLADFSFPFTDWSRIHGQFALFVKKAGRAFLLTDYLG